ncbi:unnamed protein product [Adineta steineri]|uniref:Uncharacterized protein n=1 Tax=Adineta steineri TaxID=433720 RepID=A0A819WQR7_9BILA|nr:unnamed protein product [Adineta steineri]CAF4125455.1 unnamed protein product [Adineta steineri]
MYCFEIEPTKSITFTFNKFDFIYNDAVDTSTGVSHISTPSSLRWLTLRIDDKIDLVDGNRWKILSKNLIKCNINFHVEINNIHSILDSFRNSYWLLNKCCCAAYKNQYLFTVPYFVPISTHNPYYPTVYSTVPDNAIFYDHIKHIVISELQNTTLQHLHNIEKLTIKDWISPKIFLSIVNLNRFKHLKIASLHYIHLFLMHLNPMAYLRLIYLLPQIEHLHISTIHSRKDIIRLIDGFEYLLNASFVLKCSSSDMNKRWFLKPGLSIREVRRLNNGTFTCQFDRLSTDSSLYEINLWIGEQVRKSWWIIQFPPRRGYYWYQLRHKFFHHPCIITIQNVYRLSAIIFYCSTN